MVPGPYYYIQHKLHDCPCNTHILRRLDDKVSDLTGLPLEEDTDGPDPTPFPRQVHQGLDAVFTSLTSPRQPDARRRSARDSSALIIPASGTRDRPITIHYSDLLNYAMMSVITEHRPSSTHRDRSDTEENGMPPLPLTDMEPHLSFLIEDLTTGPSRTQSPVLRQICRQVLRTYSDLYYNPLAAETPWTDTWWARHQDGWRVGGTRAPSETDFLINRYTWVSLRENEDHQLQDLNWASAAMARSTGPARAVLLIYDTITNRSALTDQPRGTRGYVLCRISPESAPILTLVDQDKATNANKTGKPMSPKCPLMLAVVENAKAPGYDPSAFGSAIAPIRGLKQPVSHRKVGWGAPDAPTDLSPEARPTPLHPLIAPSLTWYRTHCVPRRAQEDSDQQPPAARHRPSKGDMVHPTLAALGTLPNHLNKMLDSHHKDPERPDKGQDISDAILKCTMDIYRADKNFHKWLDND